MVHRRLAPLYVAALFQGAVFWYAVEKLFMVDIGFTDITIGLMVAIMSLWMLLIEPISGILADRWSRKGVMLLGALFLLLSAVVGGLSHSVPIFIMSTILWGTYSALYSGTYEAVIYDTVLEEENNAKQYKKYLARLRVIEGVSFVVGALGGGMLAEVFGLRDTFWFSVPLVCLALLFLIRVREPKLHKAEVSEPIIKHIKQTFAAILKNRTLIPVVVATIGFAVLLETIFELNQLWFIALDTPVYLYGLIGALIFATWALGGAIIRVMQSRLRLRTCLLLLCSSMIVLIISRNYYLTLSAHVLVGALLVAFGILLSDRLQGELPSRLRAGSSSVVGALTRSVIIPFSLALTVVAERSSIFTASLLLLGLAIIGSITFLRTGKIPLQAR